MQLRRHAPVFPHLSISPPVYDRQLRYALKRKVLSAHARAPGTLVLDEFGLNHGAARVDIAVVNGLIHGFEIKSDRDTLARLPAQIAVYNTVLDRVTLVVGQRHTDAAVRLIPHWWGVKIAEVGIRGAVRFCTQRRAQDNPSPDPLSVARLLWRDEVLMVLEDMEAARGLIGKPRAQLYKRLVEIAPLGIIQASVRNQLKRRTSWRAA